MSQQDDLVAAGRRLLTNNYRQAPIVFARGEGCVLYDVEGRRYLDMTAGIAVCMLGHGHAGLADAIAAQARRLLHVSNLYYSEQQVQLAEALARRAFKGRIFFTPPKRGDIFGDMGIDMRRVLHGEQHFTHHRTIYAGDDITLTTTTTDIYDKKGGALEFVVQDTAAVNQHGELCIEMRVVTVVRNA